jgi:hypothetical protein
MQPDPYHKKQFFVSGELLDGFVKCGNGMRRVNGGVA